MNDIDPMATQDVNLFFIQPDRVSHREMGPKKADLLQTLYHRLPVEISCNLSVKPGFGKMCVNAYAETFRQIFTSHQEPVTAALKCRRRQHEGDSRAKVADMRGCFLCLRNPGFGMNRIENNSLIVRRLIFDRKR